MASYYLVPLKFIVGLALVLHRRTWSIDCWWECGDVPIVDGWRGPTFSYGLYKTIVFDVRWPRSRWELSSPLPGAKLYFHLNKKVSNLNNQMKDGWTRVLNLGCTEAATLTGKQREIQTALTSRQWWWLGSRRGSWAERPHWGAHTLYLILEASTQNISSLLLMWPNLSWMNAPQYLFSPQTELAFRHRHFICMDLFIP